VAAHRGRAVDNGRAGAVGGNGCGHAERRERGTLAHPGAAAGPDEGGPALSWGEAGQQIDDGAAAVCLDDDV
jgi:hypothetical protein